MNNYRIYVEKKPEFRVEARSLQDELNNNLGLSLKGLRLLNVYDLFGFTPELLEKSRYGVFGEVVTDVVTDDLLSCRSIASGDGNFSLAAGGIRRISETPVKGLEKQKRQSDYQHQRPYYK